MLFDLLPTSSLHSGRQLTAAAAQSSVSREARSGNEVDSERSFPQQLCRHSGGPPACSIYIAPGAVDATAFINYMISTPVWQGINSTPGKMYHPSRLCGFHPLERWTQTIVIRYDTRCYFNVRSKADISQLNLPHGTDN